MMRVLDQRLLDPRTGRVASPFRPTGAGRLVAVNFHYVRPSFDDPHPGIHGCTPAGFEAQVRALGAAGDFVSLADLVAAADGTAPLPPRAIVLTFDDGLREQAEHALPVLDRLGVPAAVFVNTAPLADGRVSAVHKIHLLRARVAPARLLAELTARAARMGVAFDVDAAAAGAAAQYRYDPPETARLKFVLNFTLDRPTRDALVDGCFHDLVADDERAAAAALYMDVDALRDLAARGWLGSHGHEHLPLAAVALGDARVDVARALDHLQRWTGVRPRAMSYPYGSRAACAPAVADVARAQGVRVAFTMERACNVDLRTPLLLARLDSNDAPGGTAPLAASADLFERLPTATWFRA
ncbi:MAG: polysaccharide deacetylase family protein [Gemmatirosa sp.]